MLATNGPQPVILTHPEGRPSSGSFRDWTQAEWDSYEAILVAPNISQNRGHRSLILEPDVAYMLALRALDGTGRTGQFRVGQNEEWIELAAHATRVRGHVGSP